MGLLNSQPYTSISLPVIGDPYHPDSEVPYKQETLIQLYITAYRGSNWNICDMVVDTWIRTFHHIRHRAEKSGDEDVRIWRINDALIKRRRTGKEGFNNRINHSTYLSVQDPKLAEKAHAFNPILLAELYNNTKHGAGARSMFADSMALCGSRLESDMAHGKQYGATWHPDLMYDVLCTTLRMVGRKLTLKIEEGSEGAWCKRYHEHDKHGAPCYRTLAKDEGVVDRYEKTKGGGGGKRGLEKSDESDEDEGERRPKRAGFAVQYQDREVVDVDDEGEEESE